MLTERKLNSKYVPLYVLRRFYTLPIHIQSVRKNFVTEFFPMAVTTWYVCSLQLAFFDYRVGYGV